MFEHTIYSRVVEINAPREKVWPILLDLKNYSQWNPFTYRVVTTLQIGDPVDLYVRFKRRGEVVQQEQVRIVQAPERLAWGMKMGADFLLRAQRDQVLTALDGNRCSYQTWDAFSGLLTPLVMVLFKQDIEDGFNAMADALKIRAEALSF
ncbi:MAG TPA: SRPBCC domain-containing protein [Dongiaceae bacterium]|nr:SRPBCC domain-containing protein [Dongiaceae bacterium]